MIKYYKYTNIIHYYHRALIGNGGVTNSLWSMCRAYYDKKIKTYVAYDKKLEKKKLKFHSKKVIKLPTRHFLSGIFKFPDNFLKSFNKENTILCVHSGFIISNLIIIIFARIRKIKVILIPHGCYDPYVLNKKKILKLIWISIEKFIYKNFVIFQVFSEKDKKNIKKIFDKNKVIVVPQPISLYKIIKTKKKKSYISYLGRYDIETKGLDILIESYKLVSKNLRIPLIMHGTPGRKDDATNIKKIIKKNDLQSWIKVKGPIYGNKKINFLLNSKLAVYPSRYDNFPLSLFEALSLNVKCIVSENMMISDFLKKNNLCLISKNTPKNISKYITDFLNKKILLKSNSRIFIKKNLNNKIIKKLFLNNIENS